MTTIETVTVEQIRQLRTEAASAGDQEQVRLCDLAAGTFAPRLRAYPAGGARALAACVRAINAAEAME
ncbi:MAG TPA: hypothetical protein VFR62_10045 [Gemmatimonadales bacterium]|nr:hypothetical protein [Gemmatimonadales bacterium]